MQSQRLQTMHHFQPPRLARQGMRIILGALGLVTILMAGATGCKSMSPSSGPIEEGLMEQQSSQLGVKEHEMEMPIESPRRSTGQAEGEGPRADLQTTQLEDQSEAIQGIDKNAPA